MRRDLLLSVVVEIAAMGDLIDERNETEKVTPLSVGGGLRMTGDLMGTVTAGTINGVLSTDAGPHTGDIAPAGAGPHGGDISITGDLMGDFSCC